MVLIEEFRSRKLAHYKAELEKFDLLRGKNLELISGLRKISGVGAGINDSGQLVIMTENGIETFSSGEVTMRREISADVLNGNS